MGFDILNCVDGGAIFFSVVHVDYRPNKIITPHAHAYKCNDYCTSIHSFEAISQVVSVSSDYFTTVFALRISVTQRYQLIIKYNSALTYLDVIVC
jgi:hypothetical protein